ncbi:CRISPR-associated helicase Cas3' [Corynebacterium sp. H128]|uniref:CRISPR-associated helicase Cas3' n=1 Tax=Corynebacterium sp. H128 TaxID=3133427 RepID=UPI00309F7CE9
MSIVECADVWRSARSEQANSLWAKSGREDAYLRLPQHLIDAACVAEWLWENWVAGSLKNTLSARWKLSQEQVGRLYCFYAGTHDVGKATLSFQRLSDSSYLLAPVEAAGLPLNWALGEGENIKFPHGTASALIMASWLERWGMSRLRSMRIASVVDAHHGFTSSSDLLRSHVETIAEYPPAWSAIHTELLDSMAELIGVNDVLDQLDQLRGPYPEALQLLTGLVIMADWIASNEDAFPYDFVHPQRQRLDQAMAVIDLPSPWAPIDVSSSLEELFRYTFGWPEDFEVRPVQETAVAAAHAAPGPTLMIIEAPTGEGKTEAGLACAHVLGANTGAQGVFLAAPTMATANGLFERTVDWAQRTSVGGEVASMFLAHSKNQLSKPYRALRYSSIGADTTKYGSVIASQWLSGRNRGILADFVVGTVDQVLMMALQTRFSMLRHVGLAGKVIIIDEVHAYDAYMSQYLYCTLEWLARYGVNVILMSATLPPQQRKKLAAAYASELASEAEMKALDSAAYPLVSVVNAEGVQAIQVPPRPTDLIATVERIEDELPTLCGEVSALLIDGGIALLICNTIKRAQETFDALIEVYPGEVELHHAAFIASQRSDKEDTLRAKLGPKERRGANRPLRQVVVATQVAEQSLDIDADVLVTDIAPIDLLIQRAGRLHRHQRPNTDRPKLVQQPKIFIRGVERVEPTPVFEAGAVAIYGEKLLLATLANLPSVFQRPDDVSPLVHKVYSSMPGIPKEWQQSWQQACDLDQAKCDSAERRARTFRFPAPSQASDFNSLFTELHSVSERGSDNEERGCAQVRDAELTVDVVAIQNTQYGYIPLGGESEVLEGTEPTWKQAQGLAGNTVRLPARMTRRERDFEEIIGELEQQTPFEWRNSGMLKGQVALRFDSDGEASIGRFVVRYTDVRGLEVLDNAT